MRTYTRYGGGQFRQIDYPANYTERPDDGGYERLAAFMAERDGATRYDCPGCHIPFVRLARSPKGGNPGYNKVLPKGERYCDACNGVIAIRREADRRSQRAHYAHTRRGGPKG